MRSDLVVLAPEVFNQDLRIDSILESLQAQALISELAVERFVRSILPWLARFDVRCIDVCLRQPAQHGSGNELRSIVGPEMARGTVRADEPGEQLYDSCRSNATAEIDRQALARVFVNDCETLQLLTVGAGVVDEIIGPDLIGTERLQWSRPARRNAPARPFSRHLQAILPPDPMRTIWAHRVASTA